MYVDSQIFKSQTKTTSNLAQCQRALLNTNHAVQSFNMHLAVLIILLHMSVKRTTVFAAELGDYCKPIAGRQFKRAFKLISSLLLLEIVQVKTGFTRTNSQGAIWLDQTGWPRAILYM